MLLKHSISAHGSMGATGLTTGNCKPLFSGYGCPVKVKSGNAHNEPMMSAFHPIDGVIGRQLVDS